MPVFCNVVPQPAKDRGVQTIGRYGWDYYRGLPQPEDWPTNPGKFPFSHEQMKKLTDRGPFQGGPSCFFAPPDFMIDEVIPTLLVGAAPHRVDFITAP